MPRHTSHRGFFILGAVVWRVLCKTESELVRGRFDRIALDPHLLSVGSVYYAFESLEALLSLSNGIDIPRAWLVVSASFMLTTGWSGSPMMMGWMLALF